MKLHLTAGGVLFNKTLTKVYLVHKKSRDEWLLPKGHIEDGESPRQTARREISEETGFRKIRIIGREPVDTASFAFQDGKKKARKKISVFAAWTINQGKIITPEMKKEGLAGRWFSVAGAVKKASFDNVKKSIVKAEKRAKEWKKLKKIMEKGKIK